MKPKPVLLTLLFLPYLIWVLAVPFITMRLDSTLQSIIAMFSIVYTIGIVFWGIPYTILVIGILFWSRNKSAKEIYALLSRSPLLLALITAAEFFIAYCYFVITSKIAFSPLADFFTLIWYSLLAIVGIFVYGYAFMFLSKGLYKTFEHFKIIKNEEDISQAASNAADELLTSNLKDSENESIT